MAWRKLFNVDDDKKMIKINWWVHLFYFFHVSTHYSFPFIYKDYAYVITF